MAWVVVAAAVAGAAERDPVTGLLVAPGWESVRAHCGACHSYQLVTSQRGDAQFWRDTIRWMQRTQNLWPIADDDEARIVGYLAAHYAETDWGRRPALSPVDLTPD
jgi:hypothetical protein